MKTLQDTSFFRALDQIASSTNPGLKASRWEVAGVNWTRERHNFSGTRHGFSLETYTAVCVRGQKWELIAVSEHWWGERNVLIKSLRWARATNGKVSDVLAWFRVQEKHWSNGTQKTNFG